MKIHHFAKLQVRKTTESVTFMSGQQTEMYNLKAGTVPPFRSLTLRQ